MQNVIKKFLHSETFRYLVFGALTVAVNIAAYHVFALFLGTLAANTIAFFIAVLFAYWTNSRFVFRVPRTVKNFLQFMAMRIGTLLIDDGGMVLLLSWNWNSLLAKCVVNVVVIALNYFFSKLLIFKKTTKEGTE